MEGPEDRFFSIDSSLALNHHQPKTPSDSSQFQHGYALVVGVGGDLPVTAVDATALHNLLIDPQRCAYPKSQATLLTEARATRANILHGLEQLAIAASKDREATIIIYFSGHGVPIDQTYLMAHGFSFTHLDTTAISGTEFTERLRAIRSKKLLVLLDCCYAGGIADVKGGAITKEALSTLLDALAAGGGRVVLASSHQDQVSYPGRPYSVFTRALLEALSGNGAAQYDGYAYVADVAMYVSRTVSSRTSHKQTPMLNMAGADNFPIAYYAGGAKSPLPLPAHDETILPIIPPTRQAHRGADAGQPGLQPSKAAVRERLSEMNEDELSAFCQDNFEQVAQVVTAGMTLAARIHYLLDFCMRKPDQWAKLTRLLFPHHT